MNVKTKKIDNISPLPLSTTARGGAYLSYLDGLRALAIVSVLLFHGDNNWLHGGFLGVEIFFVISGFIISKLLFDELQQNGRIDLGRFWVRRLRRLLPAAFAMMLSTWICVLLLFPNEINQISEDLPYGVSFLNNWNYIINERSYFELIGRPRLFEHLWSLGIEFQFYVLWALCCGLLFKQPRWFATVAIAYMALYSTYQMFILYVPNEDPSRVYFGTDTRVSALLVGALLALMLQKSQVPLNGRKYQFINGLGIASLVGLIFFCFHAKSTDTTLFQGGFLCVSLLTATVIGACLLLSQAEYSSIMLNILSHPMLRFIGVRAYGIYLWHWPIFGLTQPWTDVPFEGVTLFIFRLALTAFFSEITYRFIENPVRQGVIAKTVSTVMRSTGKEKQKLVTAWSLTGCLCLAGCSSLVIATENHLEMIQRPSINADAFASLSDEHSEENNSENNNLPLVPSSPQIVSASMQYDESPALAKTNKKDKDDNLVLSNTLCGHSEHAANQNNLEFERAKNGTGYVNRVRTVDQPNAKTPVFLLGDSVMVGATAELLKRLPCVSLDSQVGRQLGKGIQILSERKNKGLLSDTVIIHLGNNSPINPNQIESLLELLSDTKRIIFINLKLPRNYESANNQLLHDAGAKKANIRLIDWRTNSMNAKNVFGSDGIHLTHQGAKLYASLISQSLLE
ncbi:MAG TPA: hypothetical protein DF614_05960 [Methylococcaceae bacterium]|nr:hypothetical protein [Methylococcaceae bacterium]